MSRQVWELYQLTPDSARVIDRIEWIGNVAVHPFVSRPVLGAPKGEEYLGVRCEVCDQPKRDPAHTDQPVLDRALLVMQHPQGRSTVIVLSDGKRREAFEKLGWRVVGFGGRALADCDLLCTWDLAVRDWYHYRQAHQAPRAPSVLVIMELATPEQVAWGVRA